MSSQNMAGVYYASPGRQFHLRSKGEILRRGQQVSVFHPHSAFSMGMSKREVCGFGVSGDPFSLRSKGQMSRSACVCTLVFARPLVTIAIASSA